MERPGRKQRHGVGVRREVKRVTGATPERGLPGADGNCCRAAAQWGRGVQNGAFKTTREEGNAIHVPAQAAVLHAPIL